MINQSAVKAILAEYQRSIADLKNFIAGISDADLARIADEHTTNTDCLSVQTVLTHVVASGFSYAVYIRHFDGPGS